MQALPLIMLQAPLLCFVGLPCAEPGAAVQPPLCAALQPRCNSPGLYRCCGGRFPASLRPASLCSQPVPCLWDPSTEPCCDAPHAAGMPLVQVSQLENDVRSLNPKVADSESRLATCQVGRIPPPSTLVHTPSCPPS